MLSLDQIRAIAREATERACQQNLTPYPIWEEDLANMPPFPFPFLGDYVPKGWEKVGEFFVDSSGLGMPNELALTAYQFLEKIKVGRGYAITEAGEFQVYVGEYIRA